MEHYILVKTKPNWSTVNWILLIYLSRNFVSDASYSFDYFKLYQLIIQKLCYTYKL